MISLTDEQKAVLEGINHSKVLKVNAFAGAGKTTTLMEMIKANPDRLFLYLVFNNRNKREAEAKLEKEGIKNAKVFTVHGYAHRKTRNFHKFKVNPHGLSLRTIGEVTGVGSYIEAHRIRQVLESWLHSDYVHLDEEVIADLTGTQEVKWDLVDKVRALKDYMEKNHITHDLYLKYFQCHFGLLETDAYDVLLLDEAQDSNPITLWLFQKIRAKRKVLVGDIHQQIYSFRGSVNGMQNVQADATLPLTTSFRFGEDIAKVANNILGIFKAEDSLLKGERKEKKEDTVAYLSRTNARLIHTIHDLGDGNWTLIRPALDLFALPLSLLAFERPILKSEISSLIGSRLNAFRYLQELGSLNEIRAQAEETDDRELLAAVKIVERFDNQLIPLFKLAQRKENNKGADTFLTTAHTSKGLEWDTVLLQGDFPEIPEMIGNTRPFNNYADWRDFVKRANGRPGMKIEKRMQSIIEEINLLYVASTRATSTLISPPIADPQQVDKIIRLVAEKREKEREEKRIKQQQL